MISLFSTPIRFIRSGTIPKNPPPRNTNTCPNGTCPQDYIEPTTYPVPPLDIDALYAKYGLTRNIAADGTPVPESNAADYWGFAGGVVAVLALAGILWATRNKMS